LDPAVLEAERAFQLGRRLLAEGRMLDACRSFLHSQSRYSSAVTLLNLGDCFERGGLEGGLLAALGTFQRALTEAARLTEPELLEGVRDECNRRIGDLEARIPSLIVRRTPTEAAAVLLNDTPIEQFDQPLPLNPGHYRLRVEAPLKQSHAQDFDLSERAKVYIALPALVDVVQAPIAPIAPGAEALAPGVGSKPRRFGDLPLWLGGATAVLGGAWLFTGLSAYASNNEYDSLLDQCTAEACTDTTRASLSEARSKSESLAIATDYVVIPAFAMTLGTGLVLWWMDDFATSDAEAAASHHVPGGLRADCFEQGCMVTARGRF
jgi:hypothetical protein